MLDKLYKIASDDLLTVSMIKEMSVSLKNIKDVKGVKSDLDLKEQRARIKNLEKQAKEDSKVQQIEVVMQGFEEYSE